MNTKLTEGNDDCPSNSTDASIGIVVSDWNASVTQKLLEGALKKLRQCGVDDADIYVSHVPGVMELTFGARQMSIVMEPSAVIVLGCVVKENNPLYDSIRESVTRGITHLNLHNDIPFIYGVLTVETLSEAESFTATESQNAGVACAMTALKMVNMMASLVNQ